MKKNSDYKAVIILSIVAAVCVLIAAAAVVLLVLDIGKEDEAARRSFNTEEVLRPQQEEPETEKEYEKETQEETEEQAEPEPAKTETKEDIQPVLDAYQSYIDEHIENREDYAGCALIYLNDDKIPECYFQELLNNSSFLSYKDGEIVALEAPSSSAVGSYQEKSNKVRFSALAGSRGYHEFYEMSDDGDAFTKIGYAATDHMEEGVYYTGEDERVGTFLDYQKYLSSMGPYLSISLSDTVEEAYGVLQIPLVKDGTGEYEFAEDMSGGAREDYSSILDPDSYEYMGSGMNDFSFSYPAQLFQYASYNYEATEGKYGTNIQTNTYYGAQGSQFKFSISLRNDPGTIKEATDFIYRGEMGSLQDASEIKHVTESDYGRVIITGYNTPRDKLVYDLVKVDKDYVMQMMIAFPVYTSEEDELYKGYVTECMYRMCGFSGSSQPPRSYEEYREAMR